MKKVKFNSKLSLNKQTVARLNEKQMSAVKGGETMTTTRCYMSNLSPCYTYGSHCAPWSLDVCTNA
jgi:natural product precursor